MIRGEFWNTKLESGYWKLTLLSGISTWNLGVGSSTSDLEYQVRIWVLEFGSSTSDLEYRVGIWNIGAGSMRMAVNFRW